MSAGGPAPVPRWQHCGGSPGHGPQQATGERCEMCAAPIAEEHSHVVNLEQPRR